MALPVALTRGYSVSARLFNSLLIFSLVLTTSMVGQLVAPPDIARADAVLDVSTSAPDPLLGENAQVGVTVTNIGDLKGYNTSVTVTIGDSVETSTSFTFSGATYAGQDIEPDVQSVDPLTGDITLTFVNVQDLAPTESMSISILLAPAGPAWEVGRTFDVDAEAEINTLPNEAGTWLGDTGTAQGEWIPIRITKSANQSTAIMQATGTNTGTGDRTHSHTLDIDNNLVNPTEDVVVYDYLPDGVEFLGILSGPALDGAYPQRDPVTGITTLRWTLGQFTPSQSTVITYETGIRYDYYGTANGGTNRLHSDFATSTALGSRVLHDTSLVNTATLDAEYLGSLPSTLTINLDDTASVTAAYLTLSKSGAPGTVVHGTVTDFTLTVYASEYYDSDTITVTDLLPDGFTYNYDAIPAPSSVTTYADGSTDIVWDPSVIGTITAGTDYTITFSATVDSTWEQPALAGQPIRAGDGLFNEALLDSTWYDQVDGVRTGSETQYSRDGASFSTQLPNVYKAVWNPLTSSWTTSGVRAQVGDDILFRVRFNTVDGTTPEFNNITLGYTEVTDWLPKGCVFTSGSAVPTYSASGDFAVPTTPTARPTNIDTPDQIVLGGIDGIQWFLGDVAADGWWETTFTATVVDIPEVTDWKLITNYWKLTGINSFGQQYSDRDTALIHYVDPLLELAKSVTSAPTPLEAGSTVEHTVAISNLASGTARDVVVVDTIPAEMRDATPTITSVTHSTLGALTEDVDYKTSWDSSTGTFTVDFNDDAVPAVETEIPAWGTLDIVFDTVLDYDVGAGETVTNLASVGYATQDDGTGRVTPTNGDTGQLNTDDDAVTLTDLSIAKVSGPTPITIGETFTSTITVTVPAGAIAYWPDIRDDLQSSTNEDLLSYVTGSAKLTTVSGSPNTGASFVSTNTPDTNSPPSSNRWEWSLNTIDNTGTAQPYVFTLSADFLVTGLADDQTTWRLWQPGGGDHVENRAYVYWDYTDTGAGGAWSGPGRDSQTDGTNTPQTPRRRVDVDQPLLTTTKQVTTPGTFGAGDTVGYRVVIANSDANSDSPAYSVTWEDLLDTYMGNAALGSITHSSLGVLTSPTVTPDFSSDSTLTIDFNAVTIAPGEDIEILYTAEVLPNVPAGRVLQNDCDADWASLPTTAFPSARVYDDTDDASWTSDADLATITVDPVTVVKTMIGPDPARLGEAVMVRIRVTVPPETVMLSPTITDTLWTDGFYFWDPVLHNAGVPSHLSGSPETTASLFGLPVTDDLSPNPGASILFNYADIDNASPASPTGDTPYVWEIYVDYMLDGLADDGSWIWDPLASNTTTDVASVAWSDGTSSHVATDTAWFEIIQPWLVTTKAFSESIVVGGQEVTTTVTVTNTGDAPAYELDAGADITDVLPQGLITADLVSLTHSTHGVLTTAGPTPDYSWGFAWGGGSQDSTLTVEYESTGTVLAPTESLTLVYKVTLDPGTGAASSLTNWVDADWSSVDGPLPPERVWDDTPGTYDYSADEASDTLTAPDATIDKSIPSGVTTYTIGDVFTYRVQVGIPLNTTIYNATISDIVPDGLTVLGATTPGSTLGTLTVGAEMAGQTPISWDVGDVSNPPTSTLTLDITVLVDDYYDGGVIPLDGLPVGLDGDAQDSITNVATLDWYSADVDGTLQQPTDDQIITIVEPNLTMTKVASQATASASDVVTYTVTVANNGVSEAYDMTWSDRIPDELFDSGSSPTLVSITHSADGLMSSPASYTADLSSAATVTVSFDTSTYLAPGESITMVYECVVEGGVVEGQTLVNDASLTTYSSKQGVDPNERTYGPVLDDVTVTAVAPALVVNKSVVGDTELQWGETISYRVTVDNVGSADAVSIVMTDTLPAGFSYDSGSTSVTWSGGSSTADPAVSGQELTWTLPAAAIDESDTLQLDFTATVTMAAPTGSAVNTVTVAADDQGGAAVPRDASTWDSDDTDPDDEDTATVLVSDPGVGVVKTLSSGDPWVQVGQAVSFDISVTNTGTTDLATVPLTDTYNPTQLTFVSASLGGYVSGPGSVTWADITGAGVLAVGQTTTVTVNFTATSVPAGHLTDDVADVSSATDIYGDVAPDAEDTATVGITRPEISIAKSLATSPTARVGDVVDFHIALTNSGTTTLTVVPLTDTYDATHLQPFGAFPSVDTTAVGSLGWADLTSTFGDLAPGQTETVTVGFMALAETVSTIDTASVSSVVDTYGDSPSDATATAGVQIVEPLLDIDKVADDTSPAAGDVVSYSVRLQNFGTGPAYNIEWSDVLDAELLSPTLTSVWHSADGTLTPASYSADFGSVPTLTASFEASVVVDPGEIIVLEYTTTVAGGVVNGQSIVNTSTIDSYSSLPGTVTVAGEAVYGPTSTVQTLTARAPAFVTTKTLKSTDPQVQWGQTVTWEFRVSNVGSATAYTVDVIDLMPAGFTYVAGSTNATWTGGTSSADPVVIAPPLLVWDFGANAVDPGDELILEFDTVVGVAAGLGTKANTAAETGGVDGGGSPVPANASVSNPADTDPDDADIATVLVTLPLLDATKVSVTAQDPWIQVGQAASFDIVVSNIGDTTMTTVPLADTFDPLYLQPTGASPSYDTTGVGTLGWTNIGPLGVGESTTVTVDFVAIAVPPGNSTVNTATVAGAVDLYGDSPPTVTDWAPQGITNPELATTKLLQALPQVEYRMGDSVFFDIGVYNTGTTTMAVVPLVDTYDTGTLRYEGAVPTSDDNTDDGRIDWTDITTALGDIAPGANSTVTVEFTVVGQSVLTTNTAEIETSSAFDVYGDPAAPVSDDETMTVVWPNLTIGKSASDLTPAAGDEVTYTVVVTNTGSGPAYDIDWQDAMDAAMFDGAGSPAIASITHSADGLLSAPASYTANLAVNPATIDFDISTVLESGEWLTLIYTATVEGGVVRGESLENTATVSVYSSLPGTDPDEATYGPVSDAEVLTARAPSLVTTKTLPGDGQVQWGQTVDWVYRVRNVGDATAYAVDVTDVMPPGFTYVTGTTTMTATSATQTIDPSIAGQVLTWDFDATIDPGEELVLVFDTVVGLATPLGVVTNLASAIGEDGGGTAIPTDASASNPADTDPDDADTATVLVTLPLADVLKTRVVAQDEHIQVGQTASFDIVVTNTGTTDIPTLPLDDTFDPAYLTPVSATPSWDTTGVGTLGWADVGPLAVGASTTITVDFTAIAVPPGNTTTNIASFTGVIDQYSDPVPDDSDDATIDITRPEVTVTKGLTAGQHPPFALGDTVSYDITVTNTGDTTITALPLVDDYGTELVYASAVPSATTASTGTASWTDLTVWYGDFEPGRTEVVTVDFTVVGASPAVPDTATASGAVDVWSDPADTVDDTATVDTYDPVDFGFDKWADPPSGSIVLPGDTITYNISLDNTTGVGFPELLVVDELPSGVTFDAGTLAWTSAATTLPISIGTTGYPTGGYDAGLHTVYVDLSPWTVAATGTVSFDVTVRDAEFSRQGLPNDAWAFRGPVEVAYDDTYHHVDPFDISKVANDLNGGRVAPGDEIEWTITVTNTGLVQTTDVLVTDTVPEHTTYVAGSITGRGADDSGDPDLVWDVGVMEVDETVVLTFVTTVDEETPRDTEIVNQAFVVSNESAFKGSDDPGTSVDGDPTLLETRGLEALWLTLAALVLLAGLALLLYARRRDGAPVGSDRRRPQYRERVTA